MRQRLVDFIVDHWDIMPRRIKLWAFMHDGDTKADIAYCVLYALVVLSLMVEGFYLLWGNQ